MSEILEDLMIENQIRTIELSSAAEPSLAALNLAKQVTIKSLRNQSKIHQHYLITKLLQRAAIIIEYNSKGWIIKAQSPTTAG